MRLISIVQLRSPSGSMPRGEVVEVLFDPRDREIVIEYIDSTGKRSDCTTVPLANWIVLNRLSSRLKISTPVGEKILSNAVVQQVLGACDLVELFPEDDAWNFQPRD